jgi:membrane fusion protein, multidrug efflux system
MSRKALVLFPILLFLCACSSSKTKEDAEESEITSNLPDKPTEVKTRPLKYQLFHYELVSNGTVSALHKADLKFQSSEVVGKIYVQNGDRVAKGQKIAALDAFKLKNSLAQAKDNLERAKLELQDVLIGQGYSLKEPNAIPAEVMKIAKVKSNYDQCRISYEMAEYNLKVSTLYAPFSGVVANLFTKENNIPDGAEPFCTVVDIQHPEVVFMILENELPLIQKGDKVLVSPFSINDYTTKGKVFEINPVVDKNGMVRIRASIANEQNKLYDGMNVKIRVQRAVNRQLVIPKEALVLRNNRKVVFTLKNGLAQWNYVQTSMENSESYVVTEGLKEGDRVIYQGNINLAHESPVVVK